MHSHDSGATLHANVLLSVKGKLCPRAVVVGNLREGFARSCIPVMIMCRMVMAMTPVCILGVILSVQPTFLFGGEQRLNTLGVVIAIAQVRTDSFNSYSANRALGVCHPRARNQWTGSGNYSRWHCLTNTACKEGSRSMQE